MDAPLTLEFASSKGHGFVRATIDDPLVAAFRRGIQDGQITGVWRYFAVTRTYGPPVVIGNFVRTPKGRLLYFPASTVELFTDDPSARFNGKTLDHITLDQASEGTHASHVAVKDLSHSKSRGLNQRSRLPGATAPWFSILTADLDGFSILPMKLIFEFPPPRKDVVAYGKELVTNGGIGSVRLLPQGKDEDYIQFDVWVGRGADWKKSPIHPLPWVYKPEIVADAPKHRQTVTFNRVDIQFAGDIGLSVVHTRPRGRLLGPRILRATLREYLIGG